MSEQTKTGARPFDSSWPIPGVLLEGGRYRLLTEVGRDDRCTARLWRGRDLMLERDVALTLFLAEPKNRRAESLMRAAVQRALRSARLETAGAARVLDVLDPDSSSGPTVAAVVAEWTSGPNLVEVVQKGLPQPPVVAGLLAPLAAAVDAAHRAGLVLGSDHPHRIRLTPEGHARLAFPGPPPQTSPCDDIRGLGAALYLLLTGHWPLPGGPGDLPAAPTRADGSPVSPRTLRAEVPVELATLALRSLAGSGGDGVHTGAAVQRMLELHVMSAAASGSRAGRAPVDPEQEGRLRRIKLGASVTALAGATLLILVYAGIQVASLFAEGPSAPPAVIVGAAPSSTQAPPPAPPPPAATVAPIPIVDVSVYDISNRGNPDNPEDVSLLLDGDPSTGWSTDSYFQPFPAFKQGLGVMLHFEQPVTVSLVTIESPSPGTVLEVRAAPRPDAVLEETTLLGTAVLDGGSTQIELQPGPATRYLLLWITGLSGGGDQNQSKLSEVGVQRRVI